MFEPANIIFETDTTYGHYQVVDMVYEGRPARVLYSGQRQAAQSGVASDGQPELLFDYNQRLFELVTHVKPKRLLLIGGGIYSLPTALLGVLSKVHIDVVEIDPGLDDIAAQYFDWQPHKHLQIIHRDGRQYLESNDVQYDLIVLDAFSHTDIPVSLTEPAALRQLKDHLTRRGLVAANVISGYFGRRGDLIHKLARTYQTYFPAVDIFPASHSLSLWIPQNFILIAQRGSARSLDKALRYPKLTDQNQTVNLSQDLGRSK